MKKGKDKDYFSTGKVLHGVFISNKVREIADLFSLMTYHIY